MAPTARVWSEQSSYSVGTDVQVHCDVQGYPESRVTWYKDNNQIQPTDRITINSKLAQNSYNCNFFFTSLLDNFKGNNSLMITGVDSADSGTYRCEAINLIGESNSVVTLSIDGTKRLKFFKILNLKNPFINYRCLSASKLHGQSILRQLQADCKGKILYE